MVQLNNNTKQTQTTAADGIVTFTGLTDNTYDIHFFMPAGYSWLSVYGIKPGLIQKVMATKLNLTQGSATSFVKIEGAISQMKNTNNFIGLSYFANYQVVSGGKINISTPNYSSSIATSSPVGTKLVGDLWALEQTISSTTNAMSLVDAVKFANKELTTVAAADPATPLDITFNTVKPDIIPLININSITLPTGMSLGYLSVSSANKNLNSKSNSINLYSDYDGSTLPLSISAADPFNSTAVDLFVSSKRTIAGSQWLCFSKISKGQTVDISAQIDGLPQLSPGQSGNTIKWSPTTGQKLVFQVVTISNMGKSDFSSLWELSILDISASEVVLPTIPASVSSRLTTRKKYNIQVLAASNINLLAPQQYSLMDLFQNQSISNGITNDYSETVLSDKVSWTR